jgi:hypothetical protein
MPSAANPTRRSYHKRTLDLAVVCSIPKEGFRKTDPSTVLFVSVPSYVDLGTDPGRLYQERVTKAFEAMGATTLWSWESDGHRHPLLMIKLPGGFKSLVQMAETRYAEAMAPIMGMAMAEKWRDALVQKFPSEEAPNTGARNNWLYRLILPLAAPFADPSNLTGASYGTGARSGAGTVPPDGGYSALMTEAFDEARFAKVQEHLRKMNVLSVSSFNTPYPVLGMTPEIHAVRQPDESLSVDMLVPWQFQRRCFGAGERLAEVIRKLYPEARTVSNFEVHRSSRSGGFIPPDPHGMDQLYVLKVRIPCQGLEEMKSTLLKVGQIAKALYPGLAGQKVDLANRENPYKPIEIPSAATPPAEAASCLPAPYAGTGEPDEVPVRTFNAVEASGTCNKIMVYSYNPARFTDSKNAIRLVCLASELEKAKSVAAGFLQGHPDLKADAGWREGRHFSSLFIRSDSRDMAGLEYRLRLAEELAQILNEALPALDRPFFVERPVLRLETYKQRHPKEKEALFFLKMPRIADGQMRKDLAMKKIRPDDLRPICQAILAIRNAVELMDPANSAQEKYTDTFRYLSQVDNPDAESFEKALEEAETYVFQGIGETVANMFPEVTTEIYAVDKAEQMLQREERPLVDYAAAWGAAFQGKYAEGADLSEKDPARGL